MKIKITSLFILSIFIVISMNPLFLSTNSFYNSVIASENDEIYPSINELNNEIIKLAVIHSKSNGDVYITIKELIKGDYQDIRENIAKKISLAENSDKTFENILDFIKEKNLINKNLKLEDIFGDKISLIYNTTEYNLSIMEPFLAHFAPIIIAGMGFGGGIGDKFGVLSGLLYSLGVIGLGGVFCIDALAKTIYIHYTFTFPLLLHLLSSFVGIMMFPVNFDFLATSGLPIFIYSNFIAIGYAAMVIGVPIGI